MYAIDGAPGLFRRTKIPLSEAAGRPLGMIGETGPYVFARDEVIEKAFAEALEMEIVSSLDRYVCDCGARTPLVAVTPEGLECPRCKAAG